MKILLTGVIMQTGVNGCRKKCNQKRRIDIGKKYTAKAVNEQNASVKNLIHRKTPSIMPSGVGLFIYIIAKFFHKFQMFS